MEPLLTATAVPTGQDSVEIILDGKLSSPESDTYKGYEVTDATVTDGANILASEYVPDATDVNKGIISVTGLTAGTEYNFEITPK